MSVDAADIESFRQFNRFYTQTIGVLTDQYLGQDRPLGEARLLFEIGATGADLRDIRARLDLDAGYLSRMLRSLQDDGLVVVRPHPEDNRVRVAELTPAGQREVAEQNERARSAVGSILEPLDAEERAEVIAAMETVRRRLRLAGISVGVIDSLSPVARHCLDAYADELDSRFPGGFDQADLVPPADARGKRGAFVVAREHEKAVGCGVIRTMEPGVGEIRHVWVAPSARRIGLGRRLLAELERQALARNLDIVKLDTHRVLTEAIAMYRACGYAEIPSYTEHVYADFWFEKRLG
ncbi:MAG: helix-turn-helix domain-containing GNAT family N-acetyltransferase [Streptosporangiaceae bacterium]|jgi:DNA-binding MarR family transcriptional regulator